MKNITNKGTKIINIGAMILLPQETKPLPERYEKSETLDFFQERGIVEILEEPAENVLEEPVEEPTQETSQKPEQEPEQTAEKETKTPKRGTAGK